MSNFLKQFFVSHYGGLESEKPDTLRYGDYYWAEDTNVLYKYNRDLVPVVVGGESGSAALVITQSAANYAALTPGTDNGELAYVYNSQGTAWLPGTVGGNYYPQGFYVWGGALWVSDRNAIAEQLAKRQAGIFDYNDAATAITPIAITGGAGYTFLTNDEAGAFTNKLYPPYGVTDVWDVNNQCFDFSQLPLGSKVEIRLDLEITTSGPNTQIEIDLELGIGNFPYDIQWASRFVKASGTGRAVVTSFVYMGDSNTLNFPAKFKIQSDTNMDVVVNGWAIHLHLY